MKRKSSQRQGNVKKTASSLKKPSSNHIISKDITNYSIQSLLIHGQFRDEHWDYRHHVVPPLSSSSAYRLEDAQRGAQGFLEFAQEQEDALKRRKSPIYIYDRLAEPTRDLLEEGLAQAEHGKMAVTFATGMAAISAAFGVTLKSGDHLVAHRVLYGCTYSLLTRWFPRLDIKYNMVDLTNQSAFHKAINPQTRVVYLETPANPNMQLIDLQACHEVVEFVNHKRPEDKRIAIIVDNTFATPFCQRPLQLGADLVVHSLTKGICGFGTDMGGAVIGGLEYQSRLLGYRKDFGGVLSPKAAWPILVYGLPSLALRINAQQQTANEVARFLDQHPKIEACLYPGLPSFPQYKLARKQMTDYEGRFAPGTMIYFILKGKPETALQRAEKLIDHLAREAYTITLAVSLGQIRTLIEHPSSMTHAAIPVAQQIKEGIDPGGVRLSIGLENPRDLIHDLSVALDKV